MYGTGAANAETEPVHNNGNERDVDRILPTELRKKITPILRKHMDVDTELDLEVRGRIKNLEEGTAAFDIEYAKVTEQMRRKKGLT